CQHVKMNGTQCESPALRRRRLCFFHARCQEQRKRIASDQFKQAGFVVPVLEDANAVQMALMQIMQLLASGQMDHKTAGLMLYALQTASTNLRHTRFEVGDVTDVVIDRDTVNATVIGGPQWFEEDFEEEDEDEVEEDAEEDEEEEEAGDEAAKPAPAAKAAKLRPNVTIAEAREQVRGLIHEWVLDSVEGKARRELTQARGESGGD
ncbi:MAG: hypothetical protein WA539_06935, partial [Candidatus Sulfotelmatobacter sp.]